MASPTFAGSMRMPYTSRYVPVARNLRARPRRALNRPVADLTEEQMNSALRRASEELAFPSYYEACVRPLLRNPEGHWPRCCAGGCEPCAQTLIQVALRTLEILGTPRATPIPEW